jgi:hypothetical protein
LALCGCNSLCMSNHEHLAPTRRAHLKALCRVMLAVAACGEGEGTDRLWETLSATSGNGLPSGGGELALRHCPAAFDQVPVHRLKLSRQIAHAPDPLNLAAHRNRHVRHSRRWQDRHRNRALSSASCVTGDCRRSAIRLGTSRDQQHRHAKATCAAAITRCRGAHGKYKQSAELMKEPT